MSKNTKQKILFIALFAVIGFGAMQVPFSQLVGAENVRFNLFDFYGPIAGGFVGSTLGLVTVAIMQIIGWAFKGFPTETAALIRLLPMLLAVLYFAKRSKIILLVPIIAMIAFWLHPEGQQAWYFALYWTIPILMYFLHDKYLFARALGSTFTAHSVGGALWIYGFNMKASIWISLIPIVWKERVLMAIGIMLTYIVFNYMMSMVREKSNIKLDFVKLNPKYSLRHKHSH
jgi:hypothetical protein